MSNIKIIRNYLKEFLKDFIPNYDNRYGKIHNIVYGEKTKNGLPTGEMAIKFYVDRKLPLSILPQNKIIPKNINIKNISVLTDVEDVKLRMKALDTCFDTDPAIQPVKANQVKRRPLQGGASSIGTYPLNTDATLGIFARDLTDGSVVAVSNNHVYTDGMVYPSQGPVGFFAQEKIIYIK